MAKSSGTSDTAPNQQVDNAAKAVGAIVAFYRRVRGLTQKKLAKESKGALSASSLAMIEGGYRLPPERTIRYLGERFGFTPFQFDQIHSLAQYPDRTTEQRIRSLIPSDVIEGIPLFVRPPGHDSALLEMANIHEVWIVTRSPLVLTVPFYQMLKRRIMKKEMSFTYFLDFEMGRAQFESVWSKLADDPEVSPKARETLNAKLKCILVPSTLTIFSFGIYDPGVPEKMFGRSVLQDQSGIAIGIIPMDSYKVGSAYTLLSRIHARLFQGASQPASMKVDIAGIGICESVIVP